MKPLVRHFGSELSSARELITSPIRKYRTFNFVRAGPGHGIDDRACEVAVSHVIGRDEHLVFSNGVDWNRLASIDSRRNVAVDKTLVDTVDEKVVEANVGARCRESRPSCTNFR